MTSLKDRDAWMQAILASREPAAAKLVGVRLALHLNVTTGRCDPSYAKLAKGTNVSERSAMRAVTALASRSWIEIVPRPGTSNSFRLLPPVGVTELCHPSRSFGGDRALSPRGVTNKTGRGDTSVTPGVTKLCHPNRELNREGALTEKENRGTREDARPAVRTLAQAPEGDGWKVHPVTGKPWRPNPNRLTRDDTLEIQQLCEREDLTEEELDRAITAIEERARNRPQRLRRPKDDWPDDYRSQFWNAYPHRVGQKPALAALGRLRRKQSKPTWDELIGGVERYAKNLGFNGCLNEQKPLNPATWITEERWNDQPANEGVRERASEASRKMGDGII